MIEWPPFSCRFGDGEALAMFTMEEGCLCHPEDRVQALCFHHIHRATPLGDMDLLFDFTIGHRLTETILRGSP